MGFHFYPSSIPMKAKLYLISLFCLMTVGVSAQINPTRLQGSIQYRHPFLSKDSLAPSAVGVNQLVNPSIAILWGSGSDYHQWELKAPSFYHGRPWGQSLGWGMTLISSYQYNLVLYQGFITSFYLGSGVELAYQRQRRNAQAPSTAPSERIQQFEGRARLAPGLLHDFSDRFYFALELPIDIVSFRSNRHTTLAVGESGQDIQNRSSTFSYPFQEGISLKISLGMMLDPS